MGDERTIFALDIGTRSVMGIIAKPASDGNLSIIDWEIREHTTRSMLDGQIHDVEAVANTILEIKSTLEQRNTPLHQVAVAAAGRALLTERGQFTFPMDSQQYISKEEVHHCELAAVQAAQTTLHEGASLQQQYYCVGYSIYNYYLDGEKIGNPIDQRGENLGVEVIATFLPQVVVDSLMAALNKAGLQLQALTLEPIAAIEAIIPSTMRRLNVALVDIGAGTSDIAITAEGTITAYGMVPAAGDEITDAISQAYLLDFPVAEQVKRQLNTSDQVSYTDILGFQTELASAEIIQTIKGEIESLAQAISTKITDLNGKNPQAVMLVGGGSLTPQLATMIARHLHMPENRVAVRDASAIAMVNPEFVQDKGPEWITPLGIVTTALHRPLSYVQVQVNDEMTRLFELRPLTISDALLAAGISMRQLHGRPGLSMHVSVNGKSHWLRGTHGEPPTILLNGQHTSLSSAIQTGDTITITPGQDGKDGGGTIRDLPLSSTSLHFEINGEAQLITPRIRCNGKLVTVDEELHDGDQINDDIPHTIEELHAWLGTQQPILRFKCNGRWMEHTIGGYEIEVNGLIADGKTTIQAGDRIRLLPKEGTNPTLLQYAPEHWQENLTIAVSYNGQPVKVDNLQYWVERNGEVAQWDELIQAGDQLIYREDEERSPVFSDVFRYVDVQLEPPGGLTRLCLRVDGEEANFQTPIHAGSALELYWE